MNEELSNMSSPSDTSETTAATSKKSRLKPALGYLFAGTCLVWVFHDVDMRDVWRHVQHVNPWWATLAILCEALSYICQGARWSLLLRPVGHISIARSTQVIYAGLFMNEVLPLKAGELVRAYLAARRLRVRLAEVIPSLIVGRLFDGIWLALGITLMTVLVPLPHSLLEAGDVFGILLVIATGIFFYVIARWSTSTIATTIDGENGLNSSEARKPPPSIREAINSVICGVQAIRLSRDSYLAFAVSFVLSLLQALSFWLVMHAYGLRLSYLVGVVIFLIVHLGTALPNAPANIGAYQFFTVVGLTLFGVDKTTAAGFSIVVFALLTLPLSVLGFLALSCDGMTLWSVREEINHFHSSSEKRLVN